MNSNKNTENFTVLVAELLSEYFDSDYETDVLITIGNPPEQCKVDIMFVGEQIIAVICKDYSWANADNLPEDVINDFVGTIDFMNKMPKDYRTIIVVKKSAREVKNETVAERLLYQVAKAKIGHIFIFEVDEKVKEIIVVNNKMRKDNDDRVKKEHPAQFQGDGSRKRFDN